MNTRCKIRLLWWVVWPILGSAVASAASNVLPYKAFPATWQAKLDEFSARGDIPGAVVIVKSPIWGVRVGTTGYANLETKTRITPDQQFRVGSVTKVFTGQLVLQLEQEGKLRLTDPILKHLADNPVVAAIPNIDKVTIGDCLQMKTGIQNYLGYPSIGNSPDVNPGRQFTPNDLLEVVTPSVPNYLKPLFAPGDTIPNGYAQYGDTTEPVLAWNYSNSNYVLLGLVIEKVSGLSMTEAVQTMICDKAGLKETFFAKDGSFPPDLMRGYTKLDAARRPKFSEWQDVTAQNPSYAWSAGAVISTPWDVLRFLETIFKTEVFLNAGTKEKWFTFVSADIHFQDTDYGMGALMQVHLPFGDCRGHGGAFPGFKTLMFHFYDSDTSFVLASNTWDGAYEVALLNVLMPLVKSPVTTPRPASDSTVLLPADSNQVQVGWQAGRIYGDSYNVFWGSDANSVDAATASSHAGVSLLNTASLTVAISGVNAGTTNYWRVDSIAGTNTVTGSLWSFKTAQAASTLSLKPPVVSEGTVTLTWPGSPGVRLQRNPFVESPNWLDVPDTDGKSNVSLPRQDDKDFFRLIRQ